MKTFAAIYIGSYEISLKIFEISAKRGLHVIDHIRHRMELGKDVYANGYVGYEMADELCRVLKEYAGIMESYRVDAYQAYTGITLKDAQNYMFLLEQIRLRTKLEVNFLSNSEQRFIGYQAVAGAPDFDDMTKESAAVVDVGGTSLQITLFLNGHVVTTQHLMLGMMRIKEKLSGVGDIASHYERQIQELVDKELEVFRALYLKEEQDIKYVILMGDYCASVMNRLQKENDGHKAEAYRFCSYIQKLQGRNLEQLAEELNLSNENDPLIVPALIMYRSIVQELNAKTVCTPGMDITDGIAYDYARKHNMVKAGHDFEADVLSASRHLAKRYFGYKPHLEALQTMSLMIFDALKKVHGLGKRERLLLQTAAIVHDCGKYVSLVNGARCSYQIIMSSEIIGLSHLEREIVACTVLFNAIPLESYEKLADRLDRKSYLTVTKLAAILRVANALDRSHKQKFKNVKASVSERSFVITIETEEDFTLEKDLFNSKASFFEEVFSLKPVIKAKKMIV